MTRYLKGGTIVSIVLTKVSGILGPFAFILGLILNGIYELMGLIGIHNLALAIILFTIVTRMLMLPLTIKQQKFTKLSALMNPELQAITEKYKGKKDEISQRRLQEETSEVYRKYGASPLGGCLPLLITLPIMFALYRVIYKMPAYINSVYSLYDSIVGIFERSGIGDQTSAMNVISNFVSSFGVPGSARGLVSEIGKYTFGSGDFKNRCIDVFSYFNQTNWDAFVNGTLIESDSWKALLDATGNTAGTWAGYLKEVFGENYITELSRINIVADLPGKLNIADLADKVNLSDLTGSIYWNTYALGSSVKTAFTGDALVTIEEILHVNKFVAGMSILDTPGSKIMPGIFIPIFAVVTQLIQTAITNVKQNQEKKKKQQEENPMAQSMKGMMVVMPFVSGVITFSLPVGVGLYWIMGTVVQIVQQLLINVYLDKKPVEEIIQKSVEKSEKRLEKYGIKSQGSGNVSYVARTSTKSLAEISRIKSDKDSSADSDSTNNTGSTGASSGQSTGSSGGRSISDLANIMKNRNK